jgi:predicted PurR-regulated permease PerM
MLVVVSIIAIWLLVKLQTLLVLLFVALLIAASMAGPVRRLESWGLSRAIAILLMFLLSAGLVVGMAWFTVPPLIGQISEAADSAPDRLAQFERFQERFNELETEYPILTEVESRAVETSGDLLESVTQSVVSLPALLTLGIFVITSLMTLSFLMLTSWARIKPAMIRLIHPDHREITERVLVSIGERLGAYVRAKVIISTIVAIWMYVVLVFLGSQIALLIAIVAGLFEIIPRIGPLLGRAIIVIAVLPLGWKAVLIAFALHMLIDNIKGSWLSPLIEGHQVEVHPLTAFIAVLAGALLLGWMGALIAVPLAAVVQVLLEEIAIPWRLRQLGDLESAPESVKKASVEGG